VQARIDRCWKPYHRALVSAAEVAVARWGGYWHLNLHSMPHDAYRRLGMDIDKPLADFVLGDRHGTTCAAAFVDAVRDALQRQGFTVAVNDPYEGQELVRMMGEPHEGRHSLQIEINRSLYMNEATREPHGRFEDVRAALGGVLEEVAVYVRQQVAVGTA
jgi:N-formylglutamate deformylase